MTSLHLDAAAASTIGRRYRDNFDVAHVGTEPLLAVVADGMGDGPGSAMAGRTTVDLLVDRLDQSSGLADIRDAVATAQQRVGDFGRQLGGLAGCTLTALIQAVDGFWVAQLGDSRLYRLRSGLLELLTVDHTVAWLGVVHGWFTLDSPEAARARYRLTRYVGHPDAPDPDLVNVRPEPGDVYLLCTDGVAEQVSYRAVDEVLRDGADDPPAAARALVDAADAAGGHDNATAVVVSVA